MQNIYLDTHMYDVNNGDPFSKSASAAAPCMAALLLTCFSRSLHNRSDISKGGVYIVAGCGLEGGRIACLH